MILLDGMIQTGRLSEFVDEFITLYNEEQQEKTAYEVWLHKVFDKSFSDFMREINGTSKTAAPTQHDIESTVRESQNILAGFVLCEGVNRKNGTVQAAGNHSG
jgi:hypothetical protein